MSTVIRRRRTARADIGPYKRYELLTGKCGYSADESFYTGSGDFDGTDTAAFISDEMLENWRANRDARPPW
jgi:hypothetical protein